MGYAFVQLDQGNKQESIRLAKKAAQLAPLWSWPLNFIGSVYYSAKNDSSLYYLDQAISINPHDFMPYDNLGNLYYESADYDKAIANYQKSIAQYSRYKYTHYNLGYAFYYVHKPEDALIQFKKTVELDPSYSLAYNGIGFLLKEQGRKEEALEQYRKAIEANPSYLAAYHNLG